MGYYDKDYLEHKEGWTKKNHKYISRIKKNGRWYYLYKAGNPNTENGFSYTHYNGPKAKRWDSDKSLMTFGRDRADLPGPFGPRTYDESRREVANNINKYGGRMDIYAGEGKTPKEAVRDSMRIDKSVGKNKQLNQDAKYLRELKEESPKAKVGSAILRLKNAETLLKKKVKDIL